MFSIGGYTYSPNFVAPLASPSKRATFARSAVKLMYTLGFDGIDIDYEYGGCSPSYFSFFLIVWELRDMTHLKHAPVPRCSNTFNDLEKALY